MAGHKISKAGICSPMEVSTPSSQGKGSRGYTSPAFPQKQTTGELGRYKIFADVPGDGGAAGKAKTSGGTAIGPQKIGGK